MSKFLRDNDDATAISIPLVFSENSRANNFTIVQRHFNLSNGIGWSFIDRYEL